LEEYIFSILRVGSYVVFVAINKTTRQYIPEGGEDAKVAEKPEFKMAAYLPRSVGNHLPSQTLVNTSIMKEPVLKMKTVYSYSCEKLVAVCRAKNSRSW
jgi:hypothetical protein